MCKWAAIQSTDRQSEWRCLLPSSSPDRLSTLSSGVVLTKTSSEVLSATAAETLRSASGSRYLGAFLQACVDANAQY